MITLLIAFVYVTESDEVAELFTAVIYTYIYIFTSIALVSYRKSLLKLVKGQF